jgi:tRNA pseudouridine32 synthase / 23S rRNA pseudouridine746 synthase
MKDLPLPSATPEILYEDDSLLAISKPAGLLSIPDGYNPALPHVAGILQPAFGKLWIVHRLDRETSGVMLLAKSLIVHHNLNLQFEHREVVKKYHALVLAHPDWEEVQIDLPLRVGADRKHRTLPVPTTGKPAKTGFRVLARFDIGCLIEASPHSGYTHQIRSHLSAIGLPIMGDLLYFTVHPGAPYHKLVVSSGVEFIQRVALHAFSIAFIHPDRHLPIQIEAAYPRDFQTAIDQLKK